MENRGIRFSNRCHAILPGYQLDFNKIASSNPREGKANVVADKNECVEGVLYDINDTDLARLDCFERYPDHYNRISVRVRLADRRGVEAITYVAQRHRTARGLKPSKSYLNYLLAAKDILSRDYYNSLGTWETLD